MLRLKVFIWKSNECDKQRIMKNTEMATKIRQKMLMRWHNRAEQELNESTTFCEILLCTNHFSSKEAVHLAHIMPELYRNTLLTCDKET